jgi:aminoglycoside phosphotransferase family enzyme
MTTYDMTNYMPYYNSMSVAELIQYRDNSNIAWKQLIEGEMLQTNLAISQWYQQIASYYSRIAKLQDSVKQIGDQAANEIIGRLNTKIANAEWKISYNKKKILSIKYDVEQTMMQWNTMINARTTKDAQG